MGNGSVRWSPEQLSDFERKKSGVLAGGGRPPAAQNSKQRLQALGRKAPGEMNKTEAAFAEHLEAQKLSGEILWYAFEAVTLKIAHDCRLTIDFFLMRADGRLEAWDVKGSFAIASDDFLVKAKVAARMFPWPFYMTAPKPKKAGGGWEVREFA
ncbi:DUF1064 domain-containing protein [Uliginosibacterium sediminicola]|uniref:DUF1064 domain-containing protein n=1 Tax=Uliginosibacterium sediminicola TaxID=2024550 RepID=A0ABU9YW40_9RHOO